VAPLPCPPGLLLTQPDKNIAVVKRCFKLGNGMCQSSYDKPNNKPGKIGIGVSLALPKFVKFKKNSSARLQIPAIPRQSLAVSWLRQWDPLITGQFNGG
jgi:hypothetical protein